MNYSTYARRPFSVEAVEITEDNIAEVAELVGVMGEVSEKDGEKYIQLDRRVVPMVAKAYIGWYLTRLDGSFRCFAPSVFHQQFEPESQPEVGEFGRTRVNNVFDQAPNAAPVDGMQPGVPPHTAILHSPENDVT